MRKLTILILISLGIIFSSLDALATSIQTNQPSYYRAAVQAGPYLYVSGQNAQKHNENLTGNIKQQTNTIFSILRATLKKHGYSFKDVVDVNVALAKQSDFGGFNKVYKTYFPNRPARSTALGVLHQDQGVLVEISLIAYHKK